MTPEPRDGLAWDDRGLDIVPKWTREPNLEAIEEVCREKLRISDSEPCEVSFFAQGAFNKLYLAHTKNRDYLMRVSLPVHPHSKTIGEVTTLRFLRRETTIPVPEIIAFDASADSKIGFEWILMERMPGVSLYKKWRTMTAYQKAALVQRVTEYQAQVFRHRFSGLGTLTLNDEGNGQRPEPGQLVSGMFFQGDHYDLDIPRGPFRSTHDWLSSYLQIVVKDHTAAKDEAEDSEDEEDAEFALIVTHKLISLLPKIFPAIQDPPERSVIWHGDLSLSNILVNEQGEITGVINWECVSAMPEWMSTQTPKFLDNATRDKEPQRSTYGDESYTEYIGVQKSSDTLARFDASRTSQLFQTTTTPPI
ncbi:phosphotransferase enzyme family-domain-containing protein [Aspergillus carlsbadensis]|nr:phosphotransferase enzyme family-domain-containing protein [Aspergillus carlsbadensis]